MITIGSPWRSLGLRLTVLMIVVTCALSAPGQDQGAAEQQAELEQTIRQLQARVAELESQVRHLRNTSRQQTDELVDKLAQEIRQSDGFSSGHVTAGYNRGFYIKSADDDFKLQFSTRLQLRHYYARTDDGNDSLATDGTPTADGSDADSSGLEFERVRLYLSGHVYEKLKYKIAMSMGDDDVTDGGAGSNARLYGYSLSYAFNPAFGLRLGRYKGAFGKHENVSSARLAMIDRSLANEIFNIGRATGLEASGRLQLAQQPLHYRLGIYNSLQGDFEEAAKDHDNSPAVATRIELPLATATLSDFKAESDLSRAPTLRQMFGFSAAFTDDRSEDNVPGGNSDSFEFLGPSIVDGRTDIFELGGRMVMLGADYSLKYRGLSFLLEGFAQYIDVNASEVSDESDFGNATRTGLAASSLENYGWHVQSGYMLTEKFELLARTSGIYVDSANDSREVAAGWNWYFDQHDLMLSMDVTYIDDLPSIASSANFDGIQNNSLLLVRTQLQFQF